MPKIVEQLSEAPDERLMARYATGETAAFDELFRRYEKRAYGFFLRRTGSPEQSQDLYQELFLRIHRARERYDPSRPFTPWFFQIASRLLVDDHRRAFRGHEVSIGERDAPTGCPGSEQVLSEREELGLLLEHLSPEERYVVLSSKIEGVGYPELSKQLGKSSDAVKKMASRAIGRLRKAALGEPVGVVAKG